MKKKSKKRKDTKAVSDIEKELEALEKRAKKSIEAVKKSTEEAQAALKAIKLPDMIPGAVNVPFTPEELSNYSQLLSIMSQGLQQMAADAIKINDETSAAILTARSQMSAVLATKLMGHYNIGESPSREIH